MPGENSTPPTARRGHRTLAIERADTRAEEALDEERSAKREALDVMRTALTERADSMEVQLDKERTRSRWLMRSFVAMTILVLLMLGSAVGIVTSGNVTIPGVGEVTVGPQRQDSPTPQPEPPLESEPPELEVGPFP